MSREKFTLALKLLRDYNADMEQERLLTTQEAAERLGLTDSRVRQLVLEGRLPAQKFGHLNMIREQDLKLVSNIKRGRPAKVDKKTSTGKSKSVK